MNDEITLAVLRMLGPSLDGTIQFDGYECEMIAYGEFVKCDQHTHLKEFEIWKGCTWRGAIYPDLCSFPSSGENAIADSSFVRGLCNRITGKRSGR